MRKEIDMKKYTALFAIDVPHYGTHDIEAEDDDAAIDAAHGLHRADAAPCYDPEWQYAACARIVHLLDPEGRVIAHDVRLDNCFVDYGGAIERLLWDNAKDMLDVLEHAIETEEGNWNGPDDEPNWLRQVRVVTAKARGRA
jgi:hypothetical protein